MDALRRTALFADYARFRLRRRFSGPRDPFAAADRTWEIAPAELIETQPAIVLNDEFERIVKIGEDTTHEIEYRRTIGAPFERPAVKAFEYRNAIIFKGAVIANGAERRILPYGLKPPPARDFPVRESSEAALAGSYRGLEYFGHWLKDDAPLSLLAAEYGEPLSPSPPSWHAATFKESHIGAYTALLELPTRLEENVRCRKLIIFDDEEFGTHKKQRLLALRRRLRERLKGAASAGARVFIRRGIKDKGARYFDNEERIVDALAQEGFQILNPATENAETISTVLSGADLVVGAEGSHQVHAIYSIPEGAGLLAITPPERFMLVNKRWADLLGVRYGYVVGDKLPDREGYRCDIDRLRRCIDLFQRDRNQADSTNVSMTFFSPECSKSTVSF